MIPIRSCGAVHTNLQKIIAPYNLAKYDLCCSFLLHKLNEVCVQHFINFKLLELLPFRMSSLWHMVYSVSIIYRLLDSVFYQSDPFNLAVTHGLLFIPHISNFAQYYLNSFLVVFYLFTCSVSDFGYVLLFLHKGPFVFLNPLSAWNSLWLSLISGQSHQIHHFCPLGQCGLLLWIAAALADQIGLVIEYVFPGRPTSRKRWRWEPKALDVAGQTIFKRLFIECFW